RLLVLTRRCCKLASDQVPIPFGSVAAPSCPGCTRLYSATTAPRWLVSQPQLLLFDEMGYLPWMSRHWSRRLQPYHSLRGTLQCRGISLDSRTAQSICGPLLKV